jgi:hypothetical protein
MLKKIRYAYNTQTKNITLMYDDNKDTYSRSIQVCLKWQYKLKILLSYTLIIMKMCTSQTMPFLMLIYIIHSNFWNIISEFLPISSLLTNNHISYTRPRIYVFSSSYLCQGSSISFKALPPLRNKSFPVLVPCRLSIIASSFSSIT